MRNGAPNELAEGECRAVAVEMRAPRGYSPLIMAEGSLTIIKWAALVLMVLDHLNKYLYGEASPLIFSMGRIVMPMFGFVLGYNLARPEALSRGVHTRMMLRLTLTGLAATPICMFLNRQFPNASIWWPLNILFTLLLAVAITYLIDRGSTKRVALAILLFIMGGALVEYLWMGVLCCLAAWHFCRKASAQRLVLWTLAVLTLTLVNGNTWALCAVPMVLIAGRLTSQLPRQTRFFYAFYPAHLLLILILRWVWF